jgi:hypothetical protein
MANRERRKGLEGQQEVARLFRDHGIGVQPFGGRRDQADHLTYIGADGATLSVEAKRQNRLRTEWIKQAEREAPAGAVPVVAWRPDGGKWWAMIPLEDLARLLA